MRGRAVYLPSSRVFLRPRHIHAGSYLFYQQDSACVCRIHVSAGIGTRGRRAAERVQIRPANEGKASPFYCRNESELHPAFKDGLEA